MSLLIVQACNPTRKSGWKTVHNGEYGRNRWADASQHASRAAIFTGEDVRIVEVEPHTGKITSILGMILTPGSVRFPKEVPEP